MKLPKFLYASAALASILAVIGCDGSGGSATSSNATLDSVVFLGKPVIISDSLLLSLIGQTSGGSSLSLSSGQITVTVDSIKGSTSTTSANVSNVQNVSASGSGALATQIIMDGSGSMSSSDPRYLRKTAGKAYVNFLASNSPNSKVALAEFAVESGDGYYFKLWKNFTSVSNGSQILPFFDSLSYEGSTPLFSSVRRGIEHLDSSVTSGYKRNILVFTDGGDNDSYLKDSVGAVISQAKAKNIAISAVGLGSTVESSKLFRMATSTGGVFAVVDSASQLVPLFTAVSQSALYGASNVIVKLGTSALSGSVYYVTITLNVNGKTVRKQFTITAQ